MSGIIIYQDIFLFSLCVQKQTEKSLKKLGSHLMPKFLNLTFHIHFLCLQRDVLLLSQIWLCVWCDSSVDWKSRLTTWRYTGKYLFNKSEKCPIKVRVVDTLSIHSTFQILSLLITSSGNKIEIFIA